MKLLLYLLIFIYCFAFIPSFGQQSNENKKADDTNTTLSCSENCSCDTRITPASVNTDHIHQQGEWMVSYAVMNMTMHGAQNGSKPISNENIYQNYMMAPTDMTMQMHMFMAMYGITNNLTLMGMTGLLVNNMNMNIAQTQMPGMNMNGMPTNMQSSSMGITDTKLSVLYRLYQSNEWQLTGNLGVSIPTGSIAQTGTTMLGNDTRLPYCMQTGTGSFAVIPTITLTNKINSFAYGVEVGGDIKLNNNAIGYKYGDVYHANIWAGYRFFTFMSGSIRAEGITTGKISGSDPQVAVPINLSNDPSADTKNTGGLSINIYAGLNFHFPQSVLNKFHLLIEYGLPAYQNLNGIQGALQSNLLAGIQFKF